MSQTRNKHYLTTYAIKIAKIKQKRISKMYNDNYNDKYDNYKKNQFDFSLCNAKSDD